MVNLVACLWEEMWNIWNKHLTSQFDACYEVWSGPLPRAKVKLICFVDTLMTLTSVNIKPALHFSLLEQTQASARSIMLTILEGRACDCVRGGFNMLAGSPWGEKLNGLLTDGRPLFQTPTVSPPRCILSSASARLPSTSLWWACLLQGNALGSTVCIARSETTHPLYKSLDPDVWPRPHFPPPPRQPSSEPHSRRKRANVGLQLAGDYFSRALLSPFEILCPRAGDFLKVLSGDLVMFL